MQEKDGYKVNEVRELYLADLNKLVSYDGKTSKRRVKDVNTYKQIPVREQTINIHEHNVYVWSDIHFGHKNIIKYSNRPYASVVHMDECLITNFNSIVGPDDISIWVGDVAFHSTELTNIILDRCNGRKILIVGNHDFHNQKLKDMNFDEIHLVYHIEYPDISLVFTHYPMDNLPKPHINIHGHLHISSPLDSDQHINVCCEFHDYKPIPLLTIVQWAKARLESLT